MTTKQQILRVLLEAAGNEVSGEKLAMMTGVSRAAVWKAISALRKEGCDISAVTNRGYCLKPSGEVINAEMLRSILGSGRDIEVHSIIDSTNRKAKELAQAGAKEGTLVCALSQTAGRGRRGRSFHSPADTGVYMSLILRPRIPADKAVLLTCRCAVAVCRAIEKLSGLTCRIKWVNDIWIGEKKVCGILCEGESELETGCLSYAVAGIGVNVSPMVFTEELQSIATSIGNECGKDISKNLLIAEICAQMDECAGTFIDEYRRRSLAVGRRVRVTDGDTVYKAVVTGIDENCSLILDTGYGKRLLRSGEIRFTED